MALLLHKHRLVPGHMGGDYEPRNVVRVNVAMHAFLHKCLWDEHGRREDLLAWQILTRLIGREQARREAVTADLKARWADTTYRAAMNVVQSNPTPAYSQKKSTSAKRQWADPEFRRKVAEGQKRRWANPQERAAAAERMAGNMRARGYHHTEEARTQIGLASQGNHYALGRHHVTSTETRAKLSAARQATVLRKRGASVS
jgi:hypothetical protein